MADVPIDDLEFERAGDPPPKPWDGKPFDDPWADVTSVPRPWCCPEPRCTPIHGVQGGDLPLNIPQPGEMFLCFGKSAPVEFVYDGVEHRNDLRTCTYTALKGVISFQENAEDWRGMAVAYNRALRALELLTAPVEHQEEGAQR